MGTRGKKVALLVVVLLAAVGLAVLLAVGGLGAMTWLVAREASELPVHRGPPDLIALGDGEAILVEGTGIEAGQLVRRMDLEGETLGERWRWQAPLGLGSYGWTWARGESHTVGELHPMQDQRPHRLVVLHDARGHVGEVEGVLDGAWDVEQETLLVCTHDALVAFDLGETLTERWRAPLPTAGQAAWVRVDGEHALFFDGALRVHALADGAPIAVLEEGELVGVDTARGEVLTRTEEGRVAVLPFGGGPRRLTLDLAEGAAVVDGMTDPALLGTHQGRWVLSYATELDHITTMNALTWTRHAPRRLVAVDPETGAVLWRAELGPFELDTRMWPRPYFDDAPLPSPLLVHGQTDVEGGGGSLGYLVSVDLTTGALVYRVTYDDATRSGALFERLGEVAYLRVRELGDGMRSALFRFERGRLSGARWLAGYAGISRPALREDEVWLSDDEGGWSLARGPSLGIVANAPGTTPPADAMPFALARIPWPDAALP